MNSPAMNRFDKRSSTTMSRWRETRYGQAVLAYVAQRPFRWSAAALAAVAAIVLLNPPREHSSSLSAAAGVVTLVSLGAAIIASGLKEQLADWRSALYPGFRAPHLVVHASLLFMLAVVFPVAIHSRIGVSALGLTALVSTAAAMFIWVILSPVSGSVAWLSALVLVMSPVQRFVGDLLMEDRPFASSIVLLAAWVAMALMWRRLVRLHERAASGVQTGATLRLRASSTGDPLFSGPRSEPLGARLVQYSSRRFEHMRNVAFAGPFARVYHWRLITSGGWSTPALGAVLALVPAVLLLMASSKEPMLALKAMSDPLVLICTLVPAFVSTLILPRRWVTLGQESLFPQTRRQFIREMGLAMLRDLYSAWFWSLLLTVAMVVVMSVLYASPKIQFNLFDPTYLWLMLCSGACEFLVFGIIVWLMRYRSGSLAVLALLPVGAAVCSVPMALNTFGAFAAVLYLLAGGLLCCDAYRRWLNAELA
jgi:hypothetical protein